MSRARNRSGNRVTRQAYPSDIEQPNDTLVPGHPESNTAVAARAPTATSVSRPLQTTRNVGYFANGRSSMHRRSSRVLRSDVERDGAERRVGIGGGACFDGPHGVAVEFRVGRPRAGLCRSPGREPSSCRPASCRLRSISSKRMVCGEARSTFPAQGARGLALVDIAIDGAAARFTISGAPGTPTFDGTLEDARITGKFRQGPASLDFELSRDQVIEPPKRPQEPVAPFPYRVEEVRYTNDDIELGGTLTLPSGDGPFAAALLITGSGAQNRDEETARPQAFSGDRRSSDSPGTLPS